MVLSFNTMPNYASHGGLESSSLNQKIPVFDGENGYRWILCTGQFWDARRTPESQRLLEAKDGLTGQALEWFRLWIQHNPTATWMTFEIAFLHRYQPDFCPVLPTIMQNEVSDLELEWEEEVTDLRESTTIDPNAKFQPDPDLLMEERRVVAELEFSHRLEERPPSEWASSVFVSDTSARSHHHHQGQQLDLEDASVKLPVKVEMAIVQLLSPDLSGRSQIPSHEIVVKHLECIDQKYLEPSDSKPCEFSSFVWVVPSIVKTNSFDISPQQHLDSVSKNVCDSQINLRGLMGECMGQARRNKINGLYELPTADGKKNFHVFDPGGQFYSTNSINRTVALPTSKLVPFSVEIKNEARDRENAEDMLPLILMFGWRQIPHLRWLFTSKQATTVAPLVSYSAQDLIMLSHGMVLWASRMLACAEVKCPQDNHQYGIKDNTDKGSPIKVATSERSTIILQELVTIAVLSRSATVFYVLEISKLLSGVAVSLCSAVVPFYALPWKTYVKTLSSDVVFGRRLARTKVGEQVLDHHSDIPCSTIEFLQQILILIVWEVLTLTSCGYALEDGQNYQIQKMRKMIMLFLVALAEGAVHCGNAICVHILKPSWKSIGPYMEKNFKPIWTTINFLCCSSFTAIHGIVMLGLGDLSTTIVELIVDAYRTWKIKESKSCFESALGIYENPMIGIPPKVIASDPTNVSTIYELKNELEDALKLLLKALVFLNDTHGQQSTISAIEAQTAIMHYVLGCIQ